MKKEDMVKMKRNWSGIALLVFTLVVGFSSLDLGIASAKTIIVPDQNATIQEGIDAATAGDTVLVREGTYKLEAALDFNGKAITVKSENGAAKCILDGQNKTRLVNFDSGEDKTTVLSGFTIQNGKADKGGGIYINASSPTITHCTIIGNKAYIDAQYDQYAYGGGIYCDSASPIISDCVISGNSAEAYAQDVCVDWRCYSFYYYVGTSYGGGLYSKGGSPTITNCTVSGNTAFGWGNAGSHGYGGGFFAITSTPSIESCSFTNNTTTANNDSQGGGLFFSTSTTPSICNTVINGNSAKIGAGVYFSESSQFSSLVNCTIVRNTATAKGGGLYFAKKSSAIVTNSILWQNSPLEIDDDNSTDNPDVSFSDVLGGYEGAGNIDANPKFVDLAKADFHLKADSPCVDVGDSDAACATTDRDGNLRIRNTIIDMGAYELLPESGSLTVIIQPQEAINDGAQWRVDGGVWRNSGTTAANLSVGEHTITFKPLPCWKTPAKKVVQIVAAQNTTVSRTYVEKLTGSLKVILTPSQAVADGAQWNVDGGGWINSGDTAPNLSDGNHTVDFKPIPGWDKPAAAKVYVEKCKTTVRTFKYVAQKTSLAVFIIPQAAIAAGAKWNVDGGVWRDSGTTVSNLSAGKHTVGFKDITGWNKPENIDVNVQAGKTTTVKRVYSADGSLTVTIGPLAAVAAGAQWAVDEGEWRDSGTTVSNLSEGNHVITFKAVSGWTEPGAYYVDVLGGQDTQVDATYGQQSLPAKVAIRARIPVAK